MVTAVASAFAQGELAPVAGNNEIEEHGEGNWRVKSFYLDSSGCARVSLPLEICFPSDATLQTILTARCLHPGPTSEANPSTTSADGAQDGSDQQQAPESSSSPMKAAGKTESPYSIAIEARVTMTSGTGEAVSAAVESITIQSTSVAGRSIFLHTDAKLRVLRQGETMTSISGVKVHLEVDAVLTEQLHDINLSDAVVNTLRLMSLGRVGEATDDHRLFRQTKLVPFALQVALTHAFQVKARCIMGSTMGNTLVSLQLLHSNTHRQPVVITNVALHPGFSRALDRNSRMASGTSEVVDMSKSVQWQFLEGCSIQFPLTLMPNEAFSTILSIEGFEDTMCRTFFSPISVNACLEPDSNTRSSSSFSNDIVSVVNVQWTTARLAVEPTDAFRVEFEMPSEQECVVGSVFPLKFQLKNLSNDTRDVHIAVSKRAVKAPTATDENFLGQAHGTTFRVPNLSDGVTPVGEANGLLSMDNALTLGGIPGGATVEAAFRFMALHEGTLRLPNLQLEESVTGQVYNCVHNLRVVATAKA